MPYITGSVDNSNGLFAHYNLLQTIHDFASSNGWQVLRYDTSIVNRELIIKGAGNSGQDEIFLCFYCYQNPDSDYYNLAAGVALGYVESNSILTQPNVIFSGVPAHNQTITYWLSVNPQRIAGVLAVGGNTVFESFYVGKFLPFEYPHKYPQPLVCIGMLNGAKATRFSDTRHRIGYKGINSEADLTSIRMFINGDWITPETWPWNNQYITGDGTANDYQHLRDLDGSYNLNQIILTNGKGNYGVLDGIAHITGFNNVVTNTLQGADGEWIIFQDVWRTGANDYFAMRAN